jgi:hypothetical protein
LKWSVICSLTWFSKTLERQGRIDIGLLQFGSRVSPPLKRGMTAAAFQSLGNQSLGHHQRSIMVQSHQDSCEEGRRLKGFVMGPQILQQFYSCILTSCITTWYGNCSASDSKAQQKVVRMAQYIPGAKLPAIQDLYNRRVRGKSQHLSETPVTQVIDCFLCYCTARCSGVPGLGPKGSLTYSTPKP